MEWEDILRIFDMLDSKDEGMRRLGLNILYSNYNFIFDFDCADNVKLEMFILYMSSKGSIEKEIGRKLMTTFDKKWMCSRM